MLESLGCHSIKEHTKEYRCGMPDRTSKTSIVVNKLTLSTRVYQAESETIKGNIFTLVMTIKNCVFSSAIKYMHEVLGIEYKPYKKSKNKDKNKIDPLAIFKNAKRRKNICNAGDMDIYNEDILDDYIPYLHIEWVRDGISPKTAEEFSIGYSGKKRRIIIPHKKWDGERNDYLGIIGRTVVKNYSMFDIPKYLAIQPFPKGMNLYGLNENYKYIQESGEVFVHEAEKSVLKRHSRYDKTGVAVCSHNLSDEQVKILIGLNVDIIICYDKGVSLQHIRSECDRLFQSRNVYYIWDKWDLLKDKEAPADKPNKIYNFLVKHKVKYDDKEHREYIKTLKRSE